MLRVISANRLQDGIVVYLGAHGDWVTHIGEAMLLTSEAACEAGWAKARHAMAANFIVDPLTVDVTEGAEGRRATTLRNAIRAFGPTINFQTSSPAA
ncbi:MAG: DUF2849 domain-containing protein [Methylovirgula sp.]